jgi:diaminohydroxyphosphoribosylaminopyrimidine deaminase/5-amino-6-(5-phosphoribosylamino)uracil reductase
MSFSAFDHECMALALELARRGLATTHPNPRVGCVIASDGRVIGQGWHKRAGGRHAEIHALDGAGHDVAGATAYVTLEPCSYSGRTPPCTAALIEAGIGRVVCAMQDPNPRVSGTGIAALQEAGIEVQCGLLADAAEELNPGFITRMRRGRPYVRVKLAQSTDGHIALADGSSQWISGPEARADVQRWRARSDALLTGIGTVLADDPRLNVRLEGHVIQPLRVVVDSHWRTPRNARIFESSGDVFVAGCECNASRDALSDAGAQTEALPGDDGRVDLKALLQELAEREINEVQVEAGAKLCGELLRLGLVDEVLIYQAPVLLGGGAVSPFAAPVLDKMDDRVHLQWIESRRIGDDLRLRMKPAGRI